MSGEILELYCCLCFAKSDKNAPSCIANYIRDFDQQGYCLFVSENERCEGRAIMRVRRVPRAEHVFEICMRSLRSPLRLHRERIKLTDCHDDFLRIQLNAKNTCNTKYIYYSLLFYYYYIIISVSCKQEKFVKNLYIRYLQNYLTNNLKLIRENIHFSLF